MMERSALISECDRYRYVLKRRWAPHGCRIITAIMLNPSTADDQRDDPTIRRLLGFARSWGFGALTVVNLFALRATDPSELARADDPIGPENQQHILGATSPLNCECVLAAWGANTFAVGRASLITRWLREAGRDLQCLGTTKSGAPRHPLYVKSDTAFRPFGDQTSEITE